MNLAFWKGAASNQDYSWNPNQAHRIRLGLYVPQRHRFARRVHPKEPKHKCGSCVKIRNLWVQVASDGTERICTNRVGAGEEPLEWDP